MDYLCLRTNIVKSELFFLFTVFWDRHYIKESSSIIQFISQGGPGYRQASGKVPYPVFQTEEQKSSPDQVVPNFSCSSADEGCLDFCIHYKYYTLSNQNVEYRPLFFCPYIILSFIFKLMLNVAL